MEKYKYVKLIFKHGDRFIISAKHIAHNLATHYADLDTKKEFRDITPTGSDRMKFWKERYREEYDNTYNDNDELLDWLFNSMDWGETAAIRTAGNREVTTDDLCRLNGEDVSIVEYTIEEVDKMEKTNVCVAEVVDENHSDKSELHQFLENQLTINSELIKRISEMQTEIKKLNKKIKMLKDNYYDDAIEDIKVGGSL